MNTHLRKSTPTEPLQILKDVSAWLTINSMRSEKIQFNMLCQQSVQNVWRFVEREEQIEVLLGKLVFVPCWTVWLSWTHIRPQASARNCRSLSMSLLTASTTPWRTRCLCPFPLQSSSRLGSSNTSHFCKSSHNSLTLIFAHTYLCLFTGGISMG